MLPEPVAALPARRQGQFEAVQRLLVAVEVQEDFGLVVPEPPGDVGLVAIAEQLDGVGHVPQGVRRVGQAHAQPAEVVQGTYFAVEVAGRACQRQAAQDAFPGLVEPAGPPVHGRGGRECEVLPHRVTEPDTHVEREPGERFQFVPATAFERERLDHVEQVDDEPGGLGPDRRRLDGRRDEARQFAVEPPQGVRAAAWPVGVVLDEFADHGPGGLEVPIPYGSSVALVGLNGAGKSTLIKLLCRFYDPTRGQILWDGTDCRDVSPAELRRRMGVLFQDYMEYDLTAAENIGVGDLDALHDRPRIEAAARMADADGIITPLPDGYDTLLSRIFFGERDSDCDQAGVTLSGGQWQRLALARALLREHPDLLILDEPSAGLDAQAESEIHQRLRHHRAGRTSIQVSHRLSAVRAADLIVVLHDGGIIERGTHDELIAAEGKYAGLFATQASGYRDERPAGTAALPQWS